MAVVQSDNRFDWCSDTWRAKRNYSVDECCNIVKNTLKQFQGAESGFIADVCSRANSAFTVSKYWFPVYFATVTATYTWDQKDKEYKETYTLETTTHHTNKNTFSETVYSNIHSGCQPGSFVGRNDDRFYSLLHVQDLDGPVYNDKCVYTASRMAGALMERAKKKSPKNNANVLLNTWNAKVVFVPIAVVSYVYNGVTYRATVNMHNGQGHFEYKASEAAKNKAKNAWTLSVSFRTVGIVASLAVALYTMTQNFWWFLLAAILSISVIVSSVKMKHDKKYFSAQYGRQGETLSLGEACKKEITLLIISVVLSIILLLLV